MRHRRHYDYEKRGPMREQGRHAEKTAFHVFDFAEARHEAL